jgi:hypothetical protein
LSAHAAGAYLLFRFLQGVSKAVATIARCHAADVLP